MDLRQLRYFVALAESGNFHRAAEALHISQPPLTVAIRKLEDELGAKLFERHARGTNLTAAGRAALPAARAALEQAEAVREAVRQGLRGTRGTISVGFVGSAISAALPCIIPAFRAQYPDVELRLEEMTSAAIAEALHARQIDVGLVRLPLMDASGLEVAVIEQDELVIALLENHRLADRGADGSDGTNGAGVALAELADEPLLLHSAVSVLRPLIILACQNAGFAPKISQEATQVQTILSLVQSGLGLALVPAGMAQIAPAGVRLLRLADPLRIELGIAMRADAENLAQNFVRTAKQAFADGAPAEIPTATSPL